MTLAPPKPLPPCPLGYAALRGKFLSSWMRDKAALVLALVLLVMATAVSSLSLAETADNRGNDGVALASWIEIGYPVVHGTAVTSVC